MTSLTDHGAAVLSDLSSRYGVSPQAVQSMMEALVRGGGTQAQFDIPELGGMGQWSWGGMTMVGDMFNTNLQALVSNLCGEIAQAMQQGPLFPPAPARPGSWQGQAQGLGQSQSQGMGQGMGLGMGAGWWPEELGQPSSQGAQNDLSYAIFPDKQRLAINLAGRVTVYDTGVHEIGGIGQQQGGSASWTFTSQFGTVDLAQLPVVPDRDPEPVAQDMAEEAPSQVPYVPEFMREIEAKEAAEEAAEAALDAADLAADEQPAEPAPEQPSEPAADPMAEATVTHPPEPAAPEMPAAQEPHVAAPSARPHPVQPPRPVVAEESAPEANALYSRARVLNTADEIIAALEKLGALRDMNVLTDAEFEAKKAELLARL